MFLKEVVKIEKKVLQKETMPNLWFIDEKNRSHKSWPKTRTSSSIRMPPLQLVLPVIVTDELGTIEK